MPDRRSFVSAAALATAVALAGCSSPAPIAARRAEIRPAPAGDPVVVSVALHHDESRAPTDPWRLAFTPYVWLFDMDGSIANGVRSIPVSTHLSDSVDLIRDHFDFGLAGHFEASRGDWSLFLDANYLRFSAEGSASRSVLRGLGTASADLSLEQELTLVEAGAAYRVAEFAVSGTRAAPVEILAGARWNHLDFDADLETSLALPRRTFERTAAANFRTDWLDGFVGVRTVVPLTDGVAILLRGDVGGAGIGSASDRVWNAIVGVNIQISECVDVFAGYRWYDFERSVSGRDTKLQMEGPGAGVTIRF